MKEAVPEAVADAIRVRYGAVAESSLSSRDAGVHAVAEAFGYSAEELRSIPAEANMGLSCGNPTATAHLRPGETVVDLGSGGGLDVFLASAQVGPTGRAIGIDMTASMVERARALVLAGGYRNVEFHLASIDRLPLPDACVDCVISNCVLNLVADKPAAFREIARVLKPGGRLAASDIALKAELPEAIATSLAAYIGCIAGAIRMESYREELLRAGFAQVDIVDTGADLNAYARVENQAGCCSPVMDGPGVAARVGNAKGPFALVSEPCCTPAAPDTLHGELAALLATYDVNAEAASVRVYAVMPATPGERR